MSISSTSSSSSASSRAPAWGRFLATALGTLGALAGALYGIILVVDPYDTLWFSPPLARAPVTTNQRFAYPALARKARFDSAVIGTSTTRLLRPLDLDRALGGAFVNLSMNSGTAWEQARILEVFAKAHPGARTVLFGIDAVWCAQGESYEKFTPRPFPEWMYDDNPWNDLLHLFNFSILQQVGRQIGHLTGLRPSDYGSDGYTDFLPDATRYDIARARTHIYGRADGRPIPPLDAVAVDALARSREWTFPAHPLFREMLAGLVPATRKVLMFVPYHLYSQRAGGPEDMARWAACKAALTRQALAYANVHVLDFMIDSAITADVIALANIH